MTTDMRDQNLRIRKSTARDIDRMLEIYGKAKQFMAENGNTRQWSGPYPSTELLRNDISAGVSYVIESDGRIVGTFAFIIGEDPTYNRIDGQWTNDKPYGTIHRIASDGSAKGIADCCLAFCAGLTDNIRIDTHEDNRIMLDWIKRSGFRYCGVIHIADGTPRYAFQLTTHNRTDK